MKFRSSLYLFVFLLNSAVFAGQSESKYEELATIYKLYKGTDYKKVIPVAEEFLKIAKSEEDYFYQVKAYIMLGYLYDQENDYNKSVIYYLEGIRVSENIDDEKLVYAKIGMNKNLGNILIEHKLFELSYQFFNTASEIAKANDRKNESLEIKLNSFGIGLLDDKILLRKYLSELDSITKTDIEDQYFLIRINNMMGIVYSSLGEKDKAATYYAKALSFDPIKNPESYFHASRNLSIIQIENNQFSEAEKSLEIAQNTLSLVKSDFNELHHSYLRSKAELYDLTNNMETEKIYLDAVKMLDSLTLDQKSLSIYKDLSKFYYNRKDYTNAEFYSNKYSEELEKYIFRQSELNELDKKHHIAMLTQHYFDTIEASESKNHIIQNAQIGGFAIISILGSIILFLLYNRNKTKQSIKKALLDIELNSEV